jgi:hypothetical protein
MIDDATFESIRVANVVEEILVQGTAIVGEYAVFVTANIWVVRYLRSGKAAVCQNPARRFGSAGANFWTNDQNMDRKQIHFDCTSFVVCIEKNSHGISYGDASAAETATMVLSQLQFIREITISRKLPLQVAGGCTAIWYHLAHSMISMFFVSGTKRTRR